MDDEPIINEIAKNIVARGGRVDVYRTGHGRLGIFRNVVQCNDSFNYSVTPSVARPKPEFWSVNFLRDELSGGPVSSLTGSEIITTRAMEHDLKMVKISDSLFHVIVPA